MPSLLDLHEHTHSDPFLRAVITAFRPNGEDFVASFQHRFVQPPACPAGTRSCAPT